MRFGQLFCLTFMALGVSAHKVHAAPEDFQTTAERLPAAAQGMRANFESIRTWVGEATITDRTSVGSTEEKTELFVQFAYDAVKDKVRWTYECVGPAEKSGVFGSKMFIRDEVFEVGPMRREIGIGQTAKLSVAKPYRGHHFGLGFDPRYFYIWKQNIPQVFTNSYEMFRKEAFDLSKINEGVTKQSVTLDGSELTLELRVDGTSVVNRFVVDLDQGCNLVRCLFSSNETEHTQEFSYAKIDGVYVPQEWTVKRRDEENERKHRVYTITQQRVNEELSANAFSLEAMGMEEGDVVMDQIRQQAIGIGSTGIENAAPVVREVVGLSPWQPLWVRIGMVVAPLAIVVAIAGWIWKGRN